MGGGEIVNSAPPVSDQELQQLRGRARLVMYGLSSELQQAQDQLQSPPAYEPQKRTKAPGSSDSNRPPDELPLTGAFASAAAGSAIVPSSSTTPSMTYPSGSGPVLGSAGPTAPIPPINPTNPPVAGPPTAPGPVSGGTVPPVIPPLDRTGNGQPPPPRSGGAGLTSGRSVSSRPATGGLPGNRVIATGGVIGGTAVAGAAIPPERTNRINPVGGVIGGAGGTGTAPVGRSSTRGQNLIGPPAGHLAPRGGGGARGQSDEEQRLWNPDHPWETNQGVEPVLLPPASTGRFDPGPAIGHLR